MTDNTTWLTAIRWNADGLVPVIAQDFQSGNVLTMAWMNRAALTETRQCGEAVYWSRSRNCLWHKGEQSGHRQIVKEIQLDCDGDTLLIKVEQIGGIACHTGRAQCFYQRLEGDRWNIISEVIKDPEEIYRKK